jgi:hypothetical protein
VTTTAVHSRAELVAVLLLSAALVIVRSLVYAVFEHADFDSDQAIIGLMAKHLSEGRAFPLFFYGQTFMLGVEAWLMAPVFWVMGPTVAALKTSLILTNVALVWLIIVGLVRWGGLRPALALVPALFVAFAPPDTARALVNAQGGNVEPLAYAALLWWLRARPFWFGSVLALGFLNREFAIYGGLVMVVLDAIRGRLFTAAGVRHWLFVLLSFVVIWDGLQALRPYAAFRGPGTRGDAGAAFGGEQIGNMLDRTSVRLDEIPVRTFHVLTRHLPLLTGGVTVINGVANQGRDWLGWLLAAVALAGIVRMTAVLIRAGPRVDPTQDFGWYLLGVGGAAVAGYIVTRPVGDVMLRYFMVALLLPVGALAVWLAIESRAAIRWGLVSVMAIWCAVSAVDHWRQWSRYHAGEPNTIRAIADAIEARGYRVLAGPYWRAYKLTFLTEERVKIASTDFVRIEEYQALARAEGPALRTLAEHPCPGAEPVADVYLCPAR